MTMSKLAHEMERNPDSPHLSVNAMLIFLTRQILEVNVRRVNGVE